MTDSFMHNHQSALDSFMENKAIQDLEDAGIYPDPDEENYPPETGDYDDLWSFYEPRIRSTLWFSSR